MIYKAVSNEPPKKYKTFTKKRAHAPSKLVQLKQGAPFFVYLAYVLVRKNRFAYNALEKNNNNKHSSGSRGHPTQKRYIHQQKTQKRYIHQQKTQKRYIRQQKTQKHTQKRINAVGHAMHIRTAPRVCVQTTTKKKYI